jgi:hypothetical protein
LLREGDILSLTRTRADVGSRRPFQFFTVAPILRQSFLDFFIIFFETNHLYITILYIFSPSNYFSIYYTTSIDNNFEQLNNMHFKFIEYVPLN